MESAFATCVAEDVPVLVLALQAFDRARLLQNMGEAELRKALLDLLGAHSPGPLFAYSVGDEVLAMLPGADDGAEKEICSRLLRGAESLPVSKGQAPLRASLSIGVAHRGKREVLLDTLLLVAREGVNVAQFRGGRCAVHTMLYDSLQRTAERSRAEEAESGEPVSWWAVCDPELALLPESVALLDTDSPSRAPVAEEVPLVEETFSASQPEPVAIEPEPEAEFVAEQAMEAEPMHNEEITDEAEEQTETWLPWASFDLDRAGPECHGDEEQDDFDEDEDDEPTAASAPRSAPSWSTYDQAPTEDPEAPLPWGSFVREPVAEKPQELEEPTAEVSEESCLAEALDSANVSEELRSIVLEHARDIGEPGLEDRLAAMAKDIAKRALEEARRELLGGSMTRPIPSQLSPEARDEIDRLRRRIDKLMSTLEQTERRLAEARAHQTVDGGVASRFKEVQGLTGEEGDYGRRVEIMSAIFEANLELARLSGGRQPDVA